MAMLIKNNANFGGLTGAQWLVMVQFSLMLLAVVPYQGIPTLSSAGHFMLVLGLLCGAWVLVVNRPENFNVSPLPKPQATLIFSGPYRFVRHPMYVALLLAVGGVMISINFWVNYAAFAGLIVLLDAKAKWEERLLGEKSDEYRAYMRNTRRFLPFIY